MANFWDHDPVVSRNPQLPYRLFDDLGRGVEYSANASGNRMAPSRRAALAPSYGLAELPVAPPMPSFDEDVEVFGRGQVPEQSINIQPSLSGPGRRSQGGIAVDQTPSAPSSAQGFALYDGDVHEWGDDHALTGVDTEVATGLKAEVPMNEVAEYPLGDIGIDPARSPISDVFGMSVGPIFSSNRNVRGNHPNPRVGLTGRPAELANFGMSRSKRKYPTPSLAHNVQGNASVGVPGGKRPRRSPLLTVGHKERFIPYLSELHNDILNRAAEHPVVPGTEEWAESNFVGWKLGLEDVYEFKKQWVRGHRGAIVAAAKHYDLPAELVAGVAYNEVGGDPPIADIVAYNLRDENRRDLPGRKLDPSRSETSFGDFSIQIRRAAQTLGYDPDKLGGSQRRAVIISLRNPQVSAFIAAKHLSDLRDIDFRGVSSGKLTRRQIEVVATRYNRGPDLPLSEILQDMDYGRDVVKRWKLLGRLVR